MWCIPPKQSASFVYHMEDVLEVYQRPVDPKRPVVCLDEKPVQLLADVREPLPCAPGEAARQDHEYQRNGTANIFCAFEPLGNWRRLAVSDRRTKIDFARFIKQLLDGRYKDAEQVVLVSDQLNTHSPASLYDAFDPEEARRLTEKLQMHHTPKHGSWLNMAEIELSVLGKRMADRVADQVGLRRICDAVEQERNDRHASTNWRFTTTDARVKLQQLYPTIEVA